MKYKISTPVREFNGNVAGVWFVNGEGETESEGAVAYFERHGYDIAPFDIEPEKNDGDQGDGTKQPATAPKPSTRSAKGG